MDREFVFTLDHIYEYGEDLEYEEIKSLGIYSTKEKAVEARDRYYKLPGFSKYPLDCFSIGKCYIDEDSAWTSGFNSSIEIEENFEVLTSCFNSWLGISKSPEDSWQDPKYYNTLCKINQEIRSFDSLVEIAKYIKQIWEQNYDNSNKSSEDYLRIATEIKNILKS